jgi:hypothetical protein
VFTDRERLNAPGIALRPEEIESRLDGAHPQGRLDRNLADGG